MKYLNLLSLTLLAACSGADGYSLRSKHSPDEFAVLPHVTSLEVPPSYALKAPENTNKFAFQQDPKKEARETVFALTKNNGKHDATQVNSAFMQQLTSGGIEPNIRETVDQEAAGNLHNSRLFAKKLMFWKDKSERNQKPGTVVNANAESARIKDNLKQGKTVTEGETPMIEKK